MLECVDESKEGVRPASLAACPDRAAWLSFWQHTATLWGVLFTVAGLICLVAWNWKGMPPMVKMGFLAAVMVALCLPACKWGAASRVGELGLLSACLCTGPLLAVFGQTYQTGAETWELFRVWAVVATALALAARRPVLWFVVWALGVVGYIMWIGARGGVFSMWRPGIAWDYWGYYTAQMAFLAAWETVLHLRAENRPGEQGGVRWMPRCMGFVLMLTLTRHLSSIVSYSHVETLLAGLPLMALYALCLGVGWWWYRWRRPELFMLACGLFSSITVAEAALFTRWHMNAFTVMVMGLLVAGSCAWGAKIVRRWQWAMLPPVTTPLATPVTRPVTPADSPTQRPPVPWFTRCLQGFGGWVAALLLFVSLILSLDGVLSFSSMATPLGMGGLGFLVAARLLRGYSAGDTIKQLALALALGGTVAVAAGLMIKVDTSRLFPVLALLALGIGCVMAASSMYRFTAALVGVPLLFLAGSAHPLLAHPVAYGVLGLALCGFMTWGFVREGCSGDLSGDRLGLHPVLRPYLLGVFAGLPLTLCFVLFAGRRFLRELTLPEPGLLGVCAGVVLTGLVFHLVRPTARKTLPPRDAGLVALTMATVPLSWFMPGLSLGVLGFMLGRWRGSRVMLGFTVAWLVVFFLRYYYSMETTLLVKSVVLMGNGLVLLSVSRVLVRLLGSHAEHVTGHDAPSELATGNQIAGQNEDQHTGASVALRAGWQRFACALPVLVCVLLFAGVVVSARQNDQRLLHDRPIFLELAPVDPRELLLGDYMDLYYVINDVIRDVRRESKENRAARVAIVRLDWEGVGHFVRLEDGTPLQKDEARLRFRVSSWRVDAAPSRFYFQQGMDKRMQHAKYGELRVNESGEYLLKGLLDDNLQPIDEGELNPFQP